VGSPRWTRICRMTAGRPKAAMQAGPNIRGALIGRNVIFPGPDDPRAMAAAVAVIVHERADVEAALAVITAERGKDPRLLP